MKNDPLTKLRRARYAGCGDKVGRRVNLVQLDRVATWQYPTAGNAVMCDDCAERGVSPREAVEIGSSTDALEARGDVFSDLAEVLAVSGRRQEAAAALVAGLQLYREKGVTVAISDLEARLAGLGSGAT